MKRILKTVGFFFGVLIGAPLLMVATLIAIAWPMVLVFYVGTVYFDNNPAVVFLALFAQLDWIVAVLCAPIAWEKFGKRRSQND